MIAAEQATILICAGGTGGHVFPGLAVAARLKASGARVLWLGTPQGMESRVVPDAGFEFHAVPVRGLRGKGLLRWPVTAWRALRALASCLGLLWHVRPSTVLGMGGYVSGPAGLAAWLARRPLVVHEQNAIPGMTNRWLARVATRVLAAFPCSFPVTVGARVTGNPVRREITAMAAPQPIAADRPLHLLVMGGSLGALALNEGVPAALAQIASDQRPQVRHQAGRGKAEMTRKNYQEHAVEAVVSEFVDDMCEVYGWADLVICRAGALTVSELMAAGVASVLVPFPFAVDDHQTVNARFLTEAGAAHLMPQTELNPEKLSSLLHSLLRDRGHLHAMAQNAYRLAKRDATQSVADVCEELAA